MRANATVASGRASAEFKVDGKAVAHAGQIHPRVTSALALPDATAAFAPPLFSKTAET